MTASAALDPVVVYDTMREAANRLAAHYLRLADDRANEVTVIAEVRRIQAESRAVPTRDVPAQLAKAEDFDARLRALRS